MCITKIVGPWRSFYLLIFMILMSLDCFGQYSKSPESVKPEDSIYSQDSLITPNLKTPFFQTKAVKIGLPPLIFFTASALTWNDREHIREIRNRYIPTFEHHYDNYLQYVPAASVYALNLAGVKGRNKLGRATVSYAASAVIMAVLVNSIKYTAKVERPDGSANNSFPSGHTSNAFMNATFLHKEYGQISPIYSISGYTMSTFTALGRELNNRHWISDVLAGAGIGILSTQLGYFFVNKMYKNEGDRPGGERFDDPLEKPSFLSLKLGYALSSRNLVENFDIGIHSKSGFEMGLEGAFYFNKHWGIGEDFTFVSFPISTNDLRTVDPNFGNSTSSIVTQSIGALNFTVGPHFTYEISEKWIFQSKIGAGVSVGATGKLSLKIKDDDDNILNDEYDLLKFKPATAFKMNGGVAFTYMLNSELGITAYTDYNYSKPSFTYTAINSQDSQEDGIITSVTEKNNLNYSSSGLRLTAFF